VRSLTYEELARDYAKELRLRQITRMLTAPCELSVYEQALLIQERHDIINELESRVKRAKIAPCPHCGRV
jgi:hypothetical protein